MKGNQLKLEKSYLLLKNWWENIELTNFEKNLFNKNIILFNQQLFRLKENIIRVGVFGKAGVGKSSILNTILNENFFKTDIINGSTKLTESKSLSLKKGLIKTIELIDFPGFDIHTEKNTTKNKIKLINLDLILFTVAGDMNRGEVSELNYLINNGKKVIIILNKIDIWNNKEIHTILEKIRDKLPRDIIIPIVVNSNKKFNSLNINASLHNYLIKMINKIGQPILIYNTLQIASKLAIIIKEQRLSKRKKEAQIIIGKYATLKASSVALNPLLFLDIAGSFALDTALINELSKVYGLKIRKNSANKLIKTISINNISLGAAQVGLNTLFNLVKKISLISAPFTNGMSLVPYGPIALTQAILAVSTTKLIGKLAAKEILNKSKFSSLEPYHLIQNIDLKEIDMAGPFKIFLYNQKNNRDLSLFIP
tara:strand:+ start:391 stop:1665 length:1275 start_codon:yes stop_codon:yes gene_type:complete